jgi:hypothetical protein
MTQDKSMLFNIPGKRDILTMDVMTVKEPIVKMPISPIFCLTGSWSWNTIGSGSTKRITSLAMLAAAVAKYKAGWFTHLPPVTVMSQLMLIGWHANMTAKNKPTVYPIIKTMDK